MPLPARHLATRASRSCQGQAFRVLATLTPLVVVARLDVPARRQ